MDEVIMPGAIKPAKNVPVIFGYNTDELVGSAVVQEDGTAVITLTDQRLIELLKPINNRDIQGLSIYINPASPKDG